MEISKESSVRRLAVLKRMRGPHTRCHATGGPAAGGSPRDFCINDSNVGDPGIFFHLWILNLQLSNLQIHAVAMGTIAWL